MDRFVNEIINCIRGQRFLKNNEKLLQQKIEERLLENGFIFHREYYLDNDNLIDFFFPFSNLGIEVKIKGQKREIFRQLERYAEFSEVHGLLLISTKSIGLPEAINGKPCYFYNLSKAWL
jgi:hypothetical protein